MELETVQSLLQDSGIEVDLQTLQNPTEEFMIDLITQYLEKFKIDGNEIAKPTPEQLDCVSDYESLRSAIKAINFHAALAKICESIFLKDLQLTDITSPGCKKTCKKIKVLFNFIIYVRNKQLEKEPIFSELEDRQRACEEMINKKDELFGKTGAIITERELKLEMLEKLQKQIEEIKSQIEKDEKANKKHKMSKQVEEVTEKYQSVLSNYKIKKEKVQELLMTTKSLQAKIVKSPQEYKDRLEKVKRQLEEKLEERQNLNECINRKKTQIRCNESAENEVKMDQNKILQIGEIMKKLKELNIQLDSIKKQHDELQKEIAFLESSGSKNIHKTIDTDQKEDLETSQQLLTELHHSLSEKQREHNRLTKKLDAIKNEELTESKRLQEEMQALTIAEKNNEIEIQKYKKLFESIIGEEIDLRKTLNDMNFNCIFVYNLKKD